jgi:hypothetical protein
LLNQCRQLWPVMRDPMGLRLLTFFRKRSSQDLAFQNR